MVDEFTREDLKRQPISIINNPKTETTMEEAQLSKTWMRILLLINCIILSIGNCGGRLIMRLYFIRGGKRIWFSSWLETAGWPVTLIPLIISYLFRRKNNGPNTNPILMKHTIFIASAVIGILTGVDDYLFAYGVARLPVSTSTLIVASHLGFTALFAFLLVKQKFTAYSINSIVLLTVASGILGMNTSGDRPKGESNKLYVLGFILTLAAAALYGLILPLVEMMYIRGKQGINYTLVLEIQLVMSFFATAFCTVGMIVNNDFKVIPQEAREYELGETKYYIVAVWSAIMWQCFYVGAIGIIFCASSLFSGVAIAVLLPLTEILAVILFKEKFGVEKGVSLILSIWGFISYFYGEVKESKKEHIKSDEDQIQIPNSDITTRVSP